MRVDREMELWQGLEPGKDVISLAALIVSRLKDARAEAWR